jgi:anti-anti-sigma factor
VDVPIEQLSDLNVTVQTARFEEAFVVTVYGELDLHGADLLRTELDRVLDERAARVVVDLLRVTFLDSTSLGVLVGAAKRAHARGGRIVLVADDPRTLRVFEITGLGGVFALERSLATAVEAVTAEADGGLH